MALCAASYMWQTQFVILIVKGTIEVARSAERAFAQIDSDQPALSETDGAGPVIMSINRGFSNAVTAGLAALRYAHCGPVDTCPAQHWATNWR